MDRLDDGIDDLSAVHADADFVADFVRRIRFLLHTGIVTRLTGASFRAAITVRQYGSL
jgi:hypothetical protein